MAGNKSIAELARECAQLAIELQGSKNRVESSDISSARLRLMYDLVRAVENSLCHHCGKPVEEHAGDACMFAPTQFTPNHRKYLYHMPDSYERVRALVEAAFYEIASELPPAKLTS